MKQGEEAAETEREREKGKGIRDNEREADEQWSIHMAQYDDYQAMHAERMQEYARQEQEAHWDNIDFDSHLPYGLPQRILRSSSI